MKGRAAGHHLQASRARRLVESLLQAASSQNYACGTGVQVAGLKLPGSDTHSLLAATVMLEGQAQTDLSAQFEQLTPTG